MKPTDPFDALFANEPQPSHSLRSYAPRGLAAAVPVILALTAGLCLGHGPAQNRQASGHSSPVRHVAMAARPPADTDQRANAPDVPSADDAVSQAPVGNVAVTYTYDEPGDHVEVTYLFAADELIPRADDEVLAAELQPGDEIVLEGETLGVVRHVRPVPVGQRAPPGRNESDLMAAGYRRVIATVKHVTDTVVDLTIGGDTTTATPDHPFWVANRNAWIPAGHLLPGDLLVKADGATILVDSIGPPRHGQFTVYNLEVDDLHTYHAGTHAVLVHNGKPCLRKIVVIGENMVARVIPYAKEVGGKYYRPRSPNPANWMRNNERWIREQIKQGKEIVDIGIDPTRPTRSPYYELEKMILDRMRYPVTVVTW